jgi:multidrug resistance efflux pump
MLCSEAKAHGALSPGGKAGVSIAVIAVVAVAAFLVWWLILRKPNAGDGYIQAEKSAVADSFTA